MTIFKFKKEHFFTLGVILILLLAFFLRFYHYNDRWGLAYDQSHDALVARYAVMNAKLPLLGPFSSAGPFQTGGEWYWFIMIPTLLYPFSIMSPWIFLTSLYVFFVFCIIKFAEELIDKKFALIVGIFSAVSSAQISQGTNLANQSPQAFFSLLSIWCSIRFLRTKKRKYLFLLALFVSIAASIHLQGAALIILVILTLVFAGMPRITDFFILAGGLFIPWLPVFAADIQHGFFNTKNMIQYYLHDQYNISLDVLGRRWLTYLGVFWPKTWSYVIGGNVILGYLAGAGLFFVTVYKFLKRTLTKEFIVLLLSFLGMITILRYTRTPLFESYIVFLHPFILLFSSWLIYLLYKKAKIIGIISLLIVSALTFQKSFTDINNATNSAASNSKQLREKLLKRHPNTKFVVYTFKHRYLALTHPLTLFLYEQNLIDRNGFRVGIIGNDVINLQNISDAKLKKLEWSFITPEEVYLSTEEWYKRK